VELNPNKALALFLGSSANELRLESFARDKVLKHNSELPLNASEQDTPSRANIKESLRRFFCFRDSNHICFANGVVTSQQT